jgi:hypothetical protein
MIHPNLASKIGTTTGRLAWGVGGDVGGNVVVTTPSTPQTTVQ